jgi:hypothetical protein
MGRIVGTHSPLPGHPVHRDGVHREDAVGPDVKTEKMLEVLVVQGGVSLVPVQTETVRGPQVSRHPHGSANATEQADEAEERHQGPRTSQLERVGIELPANEVAPAEDTDGNAYPTFERHLYADADGKYPVKLNDWETTVVTTEVARRATVAWYRNPARAARSSLRIAYQDETGAWKSLEVDFLVISRKDDGTLATSIVDPHGDHLADAKFKLRALADYAEQYGGDFLRIEYIAKASEAVRVLDLKDEKVRQAVRDFDGGKRRRSTSPTQRGTTSSTRRRSVRIERIGSTSRSRGGHDVGRRRAVPSAGIG